MFYSFKFYYSNGTTRKSAGKATKPEALYNDFDGLMDWDEFDKLNDKTMDSTEKVLMIAKDIFKKLEKNLTRIEIVEVETEKIVDFIEI